MTILSRPQILLTLFVLFLPLFCQATAPLDVAINEVAWMGTKTSANDEWLELYNNTDSEIDLASWQLASQDGTPKIILSGKIPARGFYLLERTNDQTVPGILANQIYTGAMGNSGEIFTLADAQGQIIDSLDCSLGWFAGDNTNKQTMERKNSLIPGYQASNWALSQNPGGTPKEKNSASESIITEPIAKNETTTVEKIIEKNPIEAATSQILETTYPDGIIFSEILPSPEGKDDEEEWVEIQNKNNFEVDLSGWQISDTVGSPTTYVFPKETKIKPKGFLVILRPENKIVLNNSGDGLKLSQPNGKILDQVNYQSAPKGKSYNLIAGQWVWSENKTPGAANIPPTINKKDSSILSSSSTGTAEKTSDEKKLASIGEQLPKKQNYQTIFGLAALFAVISGVLILALKRLALK
jgi:hypothetical protein